MDKIGTKEFFAGVVYYFAGVWRERERERNIVDKVTAWKKNHGMHAKCRAAGLIVCFRDPHSVEHQRKKEKPTLTQ